MLVFFEGSLFWRSRAHSWKDRIRFLAHDLSLCWNAGSERCKGEKRSTERTKKARSGVCLLIQSREPWHHNHQSVHQALPETSRHGSVLFGQQHWKLPQRDRVNVYCTGTRIIPPPPLPELETSKCKHGWGCWSARSSGQQGALHQNASGSTSKGTRDRGIMSAWTIDPVCQSPFSSSFWRLFCIWK